MKRQEISPSHALLGLLLRGERYGYELKRCVDEEYAPYWRIDFGQLYRSLAKMTHAGWVKVRPEPGEGGPERKVYALTARGRREFEAWLAEPACSHSEFFVKVRLAADCGAPVTHLVEQQRRAFEDEYAAYTQSQRAAQGAGDVGRLVVTHAALRETEALLAALDLCEAIAPQRRNLARVSTSAQPLVITGSDDPLLARLAQLAHTSANVVGSVGGLLALSQHRADIAGVHLLDAETGEYNIPFVKHLLPEEDVVLINLALRENGLMLARGNPKNIRSVRDLSRRDIRFINRQQGTGTRLLLFSRLRAARINPHALSDWERTVSTHAAIADAIAAGVADVGSGLRAVAHAHGLDFVLLGVERYDLVIPRAEFESARLCALLDALASSEFRHTAETLPGYDLAHTGCVVAYVK